MSSARLLKILRRALGDSKNEGRGEHLFSCPFCHHPKMKLAVNVDSGRWHCWVCETSGKTPRLLISRFGTASDLQEFEEATGEIETNESLREQLLLIGQKKEKQWLRETVELPPEFESLVKGRQSRYDIIIKNYLINRRGWLERDIKMWRAGYCRTGEFAGRIIIPSFADNGRINYFVARDYTDSMMRYDNPKVSKNNIIFNELFLDFRRELVISEGVFDCVKLGENSVPLLGSSINTRNDYLFYKIVKYRTPVVVCLDSGENKKKIKIAKQFLRYGVEVFMADLGDYGDAGDIVDREDAKRIVYEARQITNGNILLWEFELGE